MNRETLNIIDMMSQTKSLEAVLLWCQWLMMIIDLSFWFKYNYTTNAFFRTFLIFDQG